MKLTPLLGIGICIASISIDISILEVGISSANSQPNFRAAVNALSYPRNSQRFFKRGRDQLETQILYLQQKQQQLNLNQKRYEQKIKELENLPSSRVDCYPISTPIPNFDPDPISCSKP